MSKFLKFKSITVAFLIAVIAFSCSSDDNTDITIPPPMDDDPVATFDAELSVFEEGGDMRAVTVAADGSTGAEITSKVAFTTVTNNMRRLYITESVNGGAPEPFVFTSQEVDEKPDGSLDLVGDDKTTFEFQINLPAPMAEGESIVYTFWATTGRGDFRDVTKRNAIAEDDDTAIGTITVNFGTPDTTNGNGIREFSTTTLVVPLADGSSDTFISLFDGQVYKLSQGEETAALWDFGYYFLNADGASLASTVNYPNLFDVDGTAPLDSISDLTGVDASELNASYFALSAATVADFDSVTLGADIDAIFTQTPTAQRINNLEVGNIVEVEDQYGNRALIRVDNIVPGFGSDGKIEMTVKAKL